MRIESWVQFPGWPTMFLSIVIPVRDEAGTLPVTLARLQALRRAGHEVLVVDGGSRDGTPAVVEGLADALLHSRPGRARQMNAGAAQARGEVLLFLHADTRLPEEAVTAIAAALAGGASWGRFDVRLSGDDWRLRIIERLMNLRSCLTGMATGDQALFVRRDVFERIGGFPDQPLMEDLELSRRLKRRGRPACLRPPVITSSRRWESRGVLRTVLLMWSLRLAWFLGVSPRRLVRFYYPGWREE